MKTLLLASCLALAVSSSGLAQQVSFSMAGQWTIELHRDGQRINEYVVTIREDHGKLSGLVLNVAPQRDRAYELTGERQGDNFGFVMPVPSPNGNGTTPIVFAGSLQPNYKMTGAMADANGYLVTWVGSRTR